MFLNILHQNIESLSAKIEDLESNLELMADNKIEIDVICLTEHFLKEGHESNINMTKYKMASIYSRSDQKRGGACILLRK